MADYGLKIWDANGDLTLDTTDAITRLRYAIEVDADVTDSVVLSDIDGFSTVQFAISNNAPTILPHKVTRSGTTITYTARSSDGDSECLILVFLYD